MSEPEWKAALRALAGDLDQYGDAEYTMARLTPHIEAAYLRGLQAGRSQAGYRKSTREDICPSCLSPLPQTSPSARTATESGASAGDP